MRFSLTLEESRFSPKRNIVDLQRTTLPGDSPPASDLTIRVAEFHPHRSGDTAGTVTGEAMCVSTLWEVGCG